MNETASTRLTRAVPKAVLTLVSVLLLGANLAQADTKYVSDGAVQNARGGWDLPKQGSCPADGTATTRPDCVARRFAIAQGSCTGNYSWSTGVCDDLVNTTLATCNAQPDRFWNGNGVCAIVMLGDDRNDVTCAKHGGTWVTSGECTGAWVMPARNDAAYGTAGLLTGNSPGDQCLRCHNSVTQYNSPRVRDTEDTLFMGHRNMSRPVTAGKSWGGPPFHCSNLVDTTEEACRQAGGTWDPDVYHATDTGDVFDWVSAKVTVGANTYDLKWIYGDWLSALPRAIYVGSGLNNMSYSCGRCHTTGWTSDPGTVPNPNKQPEQTFPGITWNGTGTTGQVKLGGGVAGDANVMSSWDQWGIQCSRCHGVAVDTTTNGGTPPFTAGVTGMSTHHSNLTAVDNTSGVCSDVRFSSAGSAASLEANCTANGGTFLTACSVNPTADVCTMAANTSAKCTAVSGTWVATASGWCSNAFYSDATNCTNNGFAWQDGWCKTADAKAACTGGSGDGAKTWRLNGTQQSCQVAGATWSFSKCSIEGYCNKGAAYTTLAACTTAGGQFRYNTDVVRCQDAGGKWTGSNTNRGAMITALCMNCHRQETSGLPNTNGTCSNPAKTSNGACVAAGATWTDSGNGLPMLVGPYHSTVTFPSHPHAYQFLNSPHGRYTGKFSEVATAPFGYFGTGKYLSFFMQDGEVANTGNGCTGCHEVHTSTVAGEKPFRAECNECHHKNLSLINHPAGIGTPLEKMATEPIEACASCHMPNGQHLFRINVDPTYSMIPMPAAITANVAPNTRPDGSTPNAVWNDLDASCGKCHGGGVANKATTGSINAGSAVLTVASSTGFSANEKIRITGAGAYYYDEIGQSGKNNDFDTYIKSVDSATQITLAGTATKTVTNAAVVQNAISNNASYFDKLTLAGYAAGIHNDKPTALFTAVYGANGSTVVTDASASTCSGSNANCAVYDWNWGDATAHGSGVSATHAYAAPGTYTITLSVTQYGFAPGIATRTFTAYAVDNPPAAAGSCSMDYNTWAATCSNTSTDDKGIQLATFNWGDGTVLTDVTGLGPGPFTHTFLVPGAYTIKLTVVDTTGQTSTFKAPATVAASFNYFSIGGTVFQKGGVLGLGAAQVQIKRGVVVVKNVLTAANGSYTTGALKPGTYVLTVTKSGYTFAGSATVTIGPNATQNFTATAP